MLSLLLFAALAGDDSPNALDPATVKAIQAKLKGKSATTRKPTSFPSLTTSERTAQADWLRTAMVPTWGALTSTAASTPSRA
jgi:hypothetical protein